MSKRNFWIPIEAYDVYYKSHEYDVEFQYEVSPYSFRVAQILKNADGNFCTNFNMCTPKQSYHFYFNFTTNSEESGEIFGSAAVEDLEVFGQKMGKKLYSRIELLNLIETFCETYYKKHLVFNGFWLDSEGFEIIL